MDRPTFFSILRGATADALAEFRRHAPDETPYALAIIAGPCGAYLGYAVATEEKLHRVADEYYAAGYRCRGKAREKSDNLEQLATWLRWANPDDSWYFGDFADDLGIGDGLAHLVRGGEFGEDAEDLEPFCVEVLSALQEDPKWSATAAGLRVIVGVTSGEEPRDFLRTATRANEYDVVLKLWTEFGRGEELSSWISSPRSENA
ncbi:DUF4303 domain-containing protein (plasmid) [Tundrisphaera lichenicola]|uniref:DUF4303 domain-containing protein n=1 Tax=Tundrisphaera lichenicola TaxID=2029860 RepID=UPI003EBE2AF6